MPYETDLDAAFTILLGKARGTGTVTPAPAPSPGGGGTPVAQSSSYVLVFHFGGGGSPLTVATTDPVLVETPDPGEIVWSHLYAGGPTGQPEVVSAELDLQVTRFDTFGGSSPVYGSGSPPTITADSLANTSLSGWFAHLDSGATLIARLLSFTGGATWVNLVL